MAAIGQYIYGYLSSAMSNTSLNSKPWVHPSVDDVVQVKQIIQEKSNLPLELLDTIIDLAQYWPCSTTKLPGHVVIPSGAPRENRFLLRTFPIGYPPSNDHYQMSKSSLATYPVAPPSPWPDNEEVPQNATEELLEQWTTRSGITTEHPCKKIVFTIRSHDQGMGGEAGCRGTHKASYTWFDVGLETVTALKERHILEAWQHAPRPQVEITPPASKDGTLQSSLMCCHRTIIPQTVTRIGSPPPDPEGRPYEFHHDMMPSSKRLQSNVVAMRETKEYVITWSHDDEITAESPEADALEESGRGRETGNGEFVRNLKVGDVVTIWGKSRFPGWANYVMGVQMDVYWAV